VSPSERAQAICNGMFTGHSALYRGEIEAAIKAAVEAEREACAKVADQAEQDGLTMNASAARRQASRSPRRSESARRSTCVDPDSIPSQSLSTSAAKQALVAKAMANAALIRKLERERQAGSLLAFVRYFWHVLEPAQPLVEGRVLDVMAMHPEAVTRCEIRRLLINVSPGSMKFAAGQCVLVAAAAGMASTRFISFGRRWARTLRHDSFRGSTRPAASP
jgi:hypothetical protein